MEIAVVLLLYQGVRIVLRKNRTYNDDIIPGAEGFEYKKSKTGILLIHGFTSSAWDHRYLGRYLADRGITVVAPLLKGHGTSPENLATTTDIDWKKSADDAFKRLKSITEKQFVAGDSFGGNLALILASKNNVAGVITMATPIFFKKERLLRILLPIMKFFKSYQKKWYHTSLPKEIRDSRITYDKIPLNSLKYVARALSECIKGLPKITSPILIMQSTSDFGVGEASVNFIYKHTKSEKKVVRWIKDAYHVFIIDKNKEKAFEEIYNFIIDNSKD